MLRLSAASIAAAALAGKGSWAAGAQAKPLRVAIIGAGVAGLTAAYRLERAGLKPVLFEASNRLGGRMFTLKDFYRGMFCELGGEFVDANHENLKTLSAELGVELQPLDSGEGGDDLYFLGGMLRSAKDMLDPAAMTGAFRPIAEQIAADKETLLDAQGNWTEAAGRLDRVSLKDYLEQFRGKTEDWAIKLIEVAYVSEYGLEADQQSSPNLVDFIGTDLNAAFQIFGESDEAFRIKGGSGALIDALAKALAGRIEIRLGHALAGLGVKAAAVFLIAFMKGAFGGGFAIIGIPFLSLVMDPLTAGALLAPLFVAMDLVALRYWKPSTWSKPDLAVLVPSLTAGIALGYLALRVLDPRAVAIIMALITLTFAVLWFRGGGRVTVRPRSVPKGIAAGLGSGVTTMVAHSGGPPLAMYLLPLGMAKELYAGTTSIFFTVGNAIKAGPWLLLVNPSGATWALMGISLLAVPAGVWIGWRLHQSLDQTQLYRACYGLLVITALKLLWDGAYGYSH